MESIRPISSVAGTNLRTTLRVLAVIGALIALRIAWGDFVPHTPARVAIPELWRPQRYWGEGLLFLTLAALCAGSAVVPATRKRLIWTALGLASVVSIRMLVALLLRR